MTKPQRRSYVKVQLQTVLDGEATLQEAMVGFTVGEFKAAIKSLPKRVQKLIKENGLTLGGKS